jgi:hypothetical protein
MRRWYRRRMFAFCHTHCRLAGDEGFPGSWLVHRILLLILLVLWRPDVLDCIYCYCQRYFMMLCCCCSYCQGCRMCDRWSALVLNMIEQVLHGNAPGFEAILKSLPSCSMIYSTGESLKISRWMREMCRCPQCRRKSVGAKLDNEHQFR